MVSAVQEHFKGAEAKRKKEFREAEKKAIEAEKRIGEGYDSYSKILHSITEGGEKCS
jgi:cellobiose-specific phosphotransferase system component IIA